MSLDALLAHARARRESYMRSECQILRQVGERTWDPVAGEYTAAPESVVYAGKCHVKPTYTPAERDYSTGERELTIQAYEVVLPMSAPEVDIGDVVLITASDDAWAVGQRFPVAWFENADSRTARHVTVFAQERSGAKDA